MPDFTNFNFRLGLTKTETLFPTQDRVIGTVNREFTMDSNYSVYVLHVATSILGGRSVVSGSDFGSPDNAIDSSYTLHAAKNIPAADVSEKELIVDFGSDATRTISINTGGRSLGSNASCVWKYYLSDDDISYSGSTTFLNKTYVPTEERTNDDDLGSLSSFRYLKITVACPSIVDVNIDLFEIWEPSVSGGVSALTFEILNDETSAWQTVATATQITDPSTGVITETLNKFDLPNSIAGKLRCKLVTTNGSSNESVFIIKQGNTGL